MNSRIFVWPLVNESVFFILRRFIYERSDTNIRDWSLAYSFICRFAIKTNLPNIWLFLFVLLHLVCVSGVLGVDADQRDTGLAVILEQVKSASESETGHAFTSDFGFLENSLNSNNYLFIITYEVNWQRSLFEKSHAPRRAYIPGIGFYSQKQSWW